MATPFLVRHKLRLSSCRLTYGFILVLLLGLFLHGSYFSQSSHVQEDKTRGVSRSFFTRLREVSWSPLHGMKRGNTGEAGDLAGNYNFKSESEATKSRELLVNWHPSVPSILLRKAVAYEGDLLRMDKFLYKVAVERKPVTVLAMGSSCTSELAGRKGPQLKLLNLEAHEFERVVNADGWLSSALDTLVRAYPPQEPKRWTNKSTSVIVEEPYWLLNLGIGGVGPASWAGCLGHTFFGMLPKAVDLVVVEWSLADNNDHFLENLDTVLQYIFQMWDPPPAVLFVNFFFWCRGNRWCGGGSVVDPLNGKERLGKEEQQALSWDNIGVFSFHSGAGKGGGRVSEDNITVLAQYYGLPSISMRNAFFTLAAQGQEGYLLHDQIEKNDMGLHPSPEQAKRRYADVLIHFFHHTLSGMTERRTDIESQAAGDIEKFLLVVPPPFFSRWNPEAYGRNRAQTKHCYTYETKLGLTPPIRRAEGFNFTKDPDSKYPKPGFGTWSEGSVVEFVLDTTPTSKMVHFESSEISSSAQAMVELRYLVSYERMGGVHLSCIEGCECKDVQIEATIVHHWSIVESTCIYVTQSKNCVIRLVSTKSEQGSKFKLLSIATMFRPKLESKEIGNMGRLRRVA